MGLDRVRMSKSSHEAFEVQDEPGWHPSTSGAFGIVNGGTFNSPIAVRELVPPLVSRLC